MKIQMTIEELEDLLWEHKRVISDHMTRNLSTYHWSNIHPNNDIKYDSEKAREELIKEVKSSGFPNDFNVLKKYIPESTK